MLHTANMVLRSYDSQAVQLTEQEENWDAPAQQSVTASVNEPGDVKGSRGHGDSDMPHAS